VTLLHTTTVRQGEESQRLFRTVSERGTDLALRTATPEWTGSIRLHPHKDDTGGGATEERAREHSVFATPQKKWGGGARHYTTLDTHGAGNGGKYGSSEDAQPESDDGRTGDTKRRRVAAFTPSPTERQQGASQGVGKETQGAEKGRTGETKAARIAATLARGHDNGSGNEATCVNLTGPADATEHSGAADIASNAWRLSHASNRNVGQHMRGNEGQPGRHMGAHGSQHPAVPASSAVCANSERAAVQTGGEGVAAKEHRGVDWARSGRASGTLRTPQADPLLPAVGFQSVSRAKETTVKAAVQSGDRHERAQSLFRGPAEEVSDGGPTRSANVAGGRGPHGDDGFGVGLLAHPSLSRHGETHGLPFRGNTFPLSGPTLRLLPVTDHFHESDTRANQMATLTPRHEHMCIPGRLLFPPPGGSGPGNTGGHCTNPVLSSQCARERRQVAPHAVTETRIPGVHGGHESMALCGPREEESQTACGGQTTAIPLQQRHLSLGHTRDESCGKATRSETGSTMVANGGGAIAELEQRSTLRRRSSPDTHNRKAATSGSIPTRAEYSSEHSDKRLHGPYSHAVQGYGDGSAPPPPSRPRNEQDRGRGDTAFGGNQNGRILHRVWGVDSERAMREWSVGGTRSLPSHQRVGDSGSQEDAGKMGPSVARLHHPLGHRQSNSSNVHLESERSFPRVQRGSTEPVAAGERPGHHDSETTLDFNELERSGRQPLAQRTTTRLEVDHRVLPHTQPEVGSHHSGQIRHQREQAHGAVQFARGTEGRTGGDGLGSASPDKFGGSTLRTAVTRGESDKGSESAHNLGHPVLANSTVLASPGVADDRLVPSQPVERFPTRDIQWVLRTMESSTHPDAGGADRRGALQRLIKTDTEQDRERTIATILHASRAESTHTTYRARLAEFDAFCQAWGVPALPASVDTVIDFVLHLAGSARAGSINVACAAIALAHKLASQRDPTVDTLLSNLRKGIKKLHWEDKSDDEVKRTLHFPFPVNTLRRAAEIIWARYLQEKRDAGSALAVASSSSASTTRGHNKMTSTSSHGHVAIWRPSEETFLAFRDLTLCVVGMRLLLRGESLSRLNTALVDLRGDCVTIHIRKSKVKNSGTAIPKRIFAAQVALSSLCPVRILAHYIALRQQFLLSRRAEESTRKNKASDKRGRKQQQDKDTIQPSSTTTRKRLVAFGTAPARSLGADPDDGEEEEGSATDALFVSSRTPFERLSAAAMKESVRRVARLGGFPEEQILSLSAHSLRTGGATRLAALGLEFSSCIVGAGDTAPGRQASVS
jgi:hypothetical protein